MGDDKINVDPTLITGEYGTSSIVNVITQEKDDKYCIKT